MPIEKSEEISCFPVLLVVPEEGEMSDGIWIVKKKQGIV
jgi:hypothetical protein